MKSSSSQRRKFIQKAGLFLSAMSVISVPGFSKSQKTSKIKLLNEKGELVEIESSVLDKTAKVKAKNTDINSWVKNDKI